MLRRAGVLCCSRPALRARRLTEQHAVAQADLAEREKSMEEQQARIRQAKELSADAETLDRLGREAAVLQTRAAEQGRQMSHLSGASKSLDALCDEVLDLEGNLQEHEAKRQTVVTKQQHALQDVAQARLLRERTLEGRA